MSSFLFDYVVNTLAFGNNTLFLLSVSVGDFMQPFEINVKLKGVMQDASVMSINDMHQKSRTLHCGAVSVNHQLSHLTLAVRWIVINHSVRQQHSSVSL